MLSPDVDGSYTTCYEKSINTINEYNAKLESTLPQTIRRNNVIGNDTILSKSDVLPFVLKGNEISLSEAPTDSTLPVLPIFIAHSSLSQPSVMSMNVENSNTTSENNYTPSNLECTTTTLQEEHENTTNLSNDGFLVADSDHEIVSDLGSCTAETHGKEFCTCYNCIFSEEACRDIIGSAVAELNDTLTLDTLFNQSHNQDVVQMQYNDTKKAVVNGCSHDSLGNKDKGREESLKNAKQEKFFQSLISNMNHMNSFTDNKKTLHESEKKNWNLNAVSQNKGYFTSDDLDLDQQSKKIMKREGNNEHSQTFSDIMTLNEVQKSEKETNPVYKNMNISSQNVLLSNNTLSIVPHISIASSDDKVKQVQTQQLSNLESNRPNDVYTYTGYFKVFHKIK